MIELLTLQFSSDYNFERTISGRCESVGPKPDPLQQCRDDPSRTAYHEITGYRKIPMDTCEGGQGPALTGTEKSCPGHEKEFKKQHPGPSVVGIIVAVVLIAACAAAVGYFVYTRGAGRFGRIQLGGDSDLSPRVMSAGNSVGGSVRSGLSTAFAADSPLVRVPVVVVSGVAAGALAVGGLLGGLWSRVRGGRRGAYSRVPNGGLNGGAGPRWSAGGGGGAGRSWTQRAAGRGPSYTSRGAFARARAQDGGLADAGSEDENSLLGDQDDVYEDEEGI